jgi:hypothetical protein
MTRSRIVVLILTVVALAAIVILIWQHEPLKSTLGEKGYGGLLQLSLGTVFGGLVSSVFDQLKREQEAREARRQSLRNFYSVALSAYNRTKRCRRMLTAKAIYNEGGIPHVREDEYRTLMSELEDLQLDFETMRRQIAVGDHLFGGESKELDAALRPMAHYLRGVLQEFECSRFTISGATLPLSSLPKLYDFAAHQKPSPDFNTQFKFDGVERALLKLTAS